MNALMLGSLAMVMGAGMVVEAQTATPVGPKRVIVVSIEDRKLALMENGQVKKVYSVSVGKPSTPSPVGSFTIDRRVANPTYHHAGKTVAPGPGNPVGTRWMGLSVHGYGIHGTNEPKSIGKASSHGCIRMGKADLEEFYGLVQVGDTVELVGQRNQQTAQLFGTGENPVAAGRQVLVAARGVDSAIERVRTLSVAAKTNESDRENESLPDGTANVASR
jgi:hypothetical protein